MSEVSIPKLIATDLDGTLLRSDLSISPLTQRVLSALEERSIHVVFVTARPPRWMSPLASAVGGHGRAICMNGALVFDFDSGKSTSIDGFAHAELVDLVSDLRVAIPGITFAAERPSGAVFDPDFSSAHPFGPETVIAPVESVTDDVVGKLLARLPGVADTEFFSLIDDVVGDRALLAYSGASGLAEMTAPGVTKAAALARWAHEQGIDAMDIWAFGDMPNDVPMLKWAGRGIAVANAHPETIAVADFVTSSNDEDGLAHEILRAIPDLLS